MCVCAIVVLRLLQSPGGIAVGGIKGSTAAAAIATKSSVHALTRSGGPASKPAQQGAEEEP
jgi:hypothetical protein